MDGGSLFKNSIVNQIIEESLKRNRENELWFVIRVEYSNLDDGHRSGEECTKSFEFQYDTDLNVWVIRRNDSEFHIENTESMKKYILSLGPIEYQNFINMYGSDVDPPFSIEYSLVSNVDKYLDKSIESWDTTEPLEHQCHLDILDNLLLLAKILKTPSNIKKKKTV